MYRIGFIGMLLLFFIRPIAAQQPQTITVEVERVGYNGVASLRGWSPVIVTIENTGADVQGVVQIRPSFVRNTTGRVIQPLDLPGGARKQVSLLYAPTDVGGDIRAEFIVDGTAVAFDRYAVNWQGATTALVGGFATPPATLAGLKLRGGSTQVVADLTSDQLPSSDAELINFAVIVLGAVEPTAEQVAALRRWVAAGGVLWIDMSPSRVALAETLTELLPVTNAIDPASPSRSVDITLSEKDISRSYAVQIRPLEALATADVLLQDASGTPLVVRQQLGQGQIIASAFDLGSLPVDDVTTPFLQDTLDAPRPGLILPGTNFIASLNEGSGLPAPSTILLLLLGYIIIIGPLNYLFLRRLDRREWAWYTIPATVLVWTVVAYIAGASLRGSGIYPFQLSVIESAPGLETGRLSGLVGFEAGQRGVWSIDLPQGMVAGNIRSENFWLSNENQTYLQRSDGQTTLSEWPASVSDQRAAMVAGALPVPYQIDGHVNTNGAGRALSVEITNSGDQPITDAVLVLPGPRYTALNLAAGETQTIDESQFLATTPMLNNVSWEINNSLHDLYSSTRINGEEVLSPLTLNAHVLFVEQQAAFPIQIGATQPPINGLTIHTIYLEER